MRKKEKQSMQYQKEQNKIEDNQLVITELEKFYVSNTVDNLNEIIENKKNTLVQELVTFAEEHTKPCKWDKDGCVLEQRVFTSPMVIQQYFFKSVNNIHSIIPEYNSEKLALIYDYYCWLIAEVNDKIGPYPSSLNSFCKLAGLTISQLKSIKNSSYDDKLRTVAEKIYDEIGDSNITMAQMGMVSEKSTIFKLKTQNEIVEKVQPNVNINITKQIDEDEADAILKRIGKYGNLVNKKSGQ